MQRRVVERIERGADALEVEELGLAAVAMAFRTAHQRRRRAITGARARAAHRDLAMAARAQLALRLADPVDLTTLAATLDVSPWHLCRVFKEETGMTIYGYRRDLRLRTALEHLDLAPGGISRLAHQLGFSSHSHFTAAFRRRFGFTPTERRATARVRREQGRLG
jgi:AraC-like DNA-binding protein